MDCVAFAASLKKILIAHDQAGAQLSALDSKITEISQQSLMSTLEGNRSQDLHLSLRLSVCEGVRVVYQNYQNKKQSQAHDMARSIISNLEGDLDLEMTSPVTSLSPMSNSGVDKSASKWSLAFCEFYRDS